MNSFVSKQLIGDLADSTNRTVTVPGQKRVMYFADINVTYHTVIHVLDYESQQAGLNLTHTQDRNFVQVFL